MILNCADGSRLEWAIPAPVSPDSRGGAGQPIPITIAVTPHRPAHVLTLEYRVDGGPIQAVQALPQPAELDTATRAFVAVLPGGLRGVVDCLPVLLLAGQPVSPSLATASAASQRLHLGDSSSLDPVSISPGPSLPLASPEPRPRWAWTPQFLGALTARVRKELVGSTPDGLRINWHVVSGSFVGPGLEASVCDGATDWMRIRPDGIAIVDVKASFKTSDGTIIDGFYGGMFDLGPDGFQRALEDRFDPLPPVVVTPTYSSAAPELAWLNRCQCIGIGRVDMHALEVSFDVYRFDVGDRLPGTGLA
jgi:hypothetical protein